MSNYSVSGSIIISGIYGTGFNQVQTTLKFDPGPVLTGSHFHFMQIKYNYFRNLDFRGLFSERFQALQGKAWCNKTFTQCNQFLIIFHLLGLNIGSYCRPLKVNSRSRISDFEKCIIHLNKMVKTTYSKFGNHGQQQEA